jgi:lysozyme family protein
LLSNWQKSFNNVLKYEGGYVNDPLDMGGETNMGITKNTLTKAKNEGIVRPEVTVRTLTKDDASKIYKAYYWDKMGCDDYEIPIDHIIFDTVVNHGIKGGSRIIQRAINSMNIDGIKLVTDGIFGKLSREAVDRICALGNTLNFGKMILIKRKSYYDDIIANKPSQAKFRRGWYNRINNLAKDCGIDFKVV